MGRVGSVASLVFSAQRAKRAPKPRRGYAGHKRLVPRARKGAAFGGTLSGARYVAMRYARSSDAFLVDSAAAPLFLSARPFKKQRSSKR